jgi:hypothetical protein
MFHLVSWTRLTAAAVVVVVVQPLSAVVSALGTLCLLALVLIGLNVVEYTRVKQIGWRALLAARER